jgi:hypothetical protein
MTVAEIEESARSQFNGIGDSFFSTTDFFPAIYQASLQLAREALVIEETYETTTVADTQEYSFPTNTISLKRVTYDGVKLTPITMREDDELTVTDASANSTGTPAYYSIWNDTISLRPIPAAAGTLKIYSYNEPGAVTAASILDVPTLFHMDIVDFVLSKMYAKDKDFQAATYHMDLWKEHVLAAKRWAKKRLRGDAMAHVHAEGAS